MGLHTHHLLSKGELYYNNRTPNGAMRVSHTPGSEQLEENRVAELLERHTLAPGSPYWTSSGIAAEQETPQSQRVASLLANGIVWLSWRNMVRDSTVTVLALGRHLG